MVLEQRYSGEAQLYSCPYLCAPIAGLLHLALHQGVVCLGGIPEAGLALEMLRAQTEQLFVLHAREAGRRAALTMLPLVQTQQGRVSTASISQGGRHLLQGATGANSNQGTQQQTPSSPTSSAPAPQAPVQEGLTPAAAGQKSGYFGSGPFNNKVYSQSTPVQLSSLGLTKGVQYVVTTSVSVTGTARWASSTMCHQTYPSAIDQVSWFASGGSSACT